MHPKFENRIKDLNRTAKSAGDNVDNGGGPPHDGDMEARVVKLEEFAAETRERLIKIDSRLDGIDTRMATKADLHESANGIIKWMVGTAAAIAAAFITVMTFVLNNAVPKQAAPQAPAPIVIQVPTPTAPSTPAK